MRGFVKVSEGDERYSCRAFRIFEFVSKVASRVVNVWLSLGKRCDVYFSGVAVR